MASPPKLCIAPESEILYDPLSTLETSRSIQILNNIVQTCYGARGRVKALQNANNTALTLTSASSVLFHRLSCKNPFAKLIIACAKNRSDVDSDCGLLTALIMTSFLLTRFDTSVPKMLFADVNDHIAKVCMTYLESNDCQCKVAVQMETVCQLRSIVKSILCSKPGCVLNQNEKDHISLLIIKSFLNTVPTSVGEQLGKVHIIANEGSSPIQSKTLPGIVIPYPTSAGKNCNEKFRRKLKVILFTTSLSGDAEFPVKKLEVVKGIKVWDEVLNHLRNLASKIIQLKVDIVFCQKVIHPAIKEQLVMKDIIVFDRMGAVNAQAIQQSTAAYPVQSIFLPDIPDLFGYVDSAQIVKIGGKSYINLQCSEQVCTLLLCHSIPSSMEELKIVCRQAIDALSRLIISKKAFFGAGCSETCLAAFVNAEVHNTVNNISQKYRCTNSQVLTVANNFINVLHSIAVNVQAGKMCDFLTDSIYHHLWESTADQCACGQFLKCNLHTAKWICLDVKGHSSDSAFAVSVTHIEYDIVLDEYSNKLHAYSKAFDLLSLLLRTGTCIINRT